MQKVRKILRVVSGIFKDGPTDGPRTDMGDYIGPSWVNPGYNMGLKVLVSPIKKNFTKIPF